MQIICNNCGNNLEFPNRQVYVTCPQCFTHLQIEESDHRIFATIIEEKDVDNSIFQNNDLISTDFPNDLYDLLHLEGEYVEMLEDTAFYSLSQRGKKRPSSFRAIFRFLLFGLTILGFLNGLAFYLRHGGDSWSLLFGSFFLAYAIFLLIISGKEFRRALALQRFEKYYLAERLQLLTALKAESLPNSIRQALNDLSDNYNEQTEIIEEFFYVQFLKILHIKSGQPSVSKALRIFILVILIGFIATVNGFYGYLSVFLLVVFIILSIFFGLTISGDTTEYQRVSKLNQTERQAILDKLSRLIR